MTTIDDKVVAMSFESSKFEAGVNSAISALEKLKAALRFPDAGKGLDDINASAKRVDLSHIAQGVDDIKGKLSALSVAALAVFAQIAQKAVAAGAQLIKSLTIDPIKQGFQEYATNLNAIQTILANTQAAGAGLKEVNAALNELNRYSDKTIYNFSQMAKNIGTFTAAGVDLKTSTEAIKGIANLAALSGSNADQASTAMYQLSQAIAAGSVKLQDWNSVVNAGMGGTVFQRALAQTAEAMGTLNKGAVKLTGPMKNVTIAGEAFRQSLSTPGKASWLTSKVLTTTLKQFTGDLTDAQLKAEGFNAEQIKAIQQTAKTAMHAATEVKTLSQVLDVAKETAGSGWAQTWQIIFGDFAEAKTTFTNLSNTINGFINANADARNKVLADWKALGGRTVLIDGIKTAFKNLGEILKPIKEAFRDIFPAATGQKLFDLTKKFQQFAEALKPSPATIEGLRRTFRGLFAVLDIGKQLISGIFTVFSQMFKAIAGGSGSFLKITGSIGDFLVSIDQALKKGDRLHNFFLTLGSLLAAPIKLLAALAHALSDLFSGFSPGGISDQLGGITKAMTPFQKIVEVVSTAWAKFLDGISNSGQVLQPAIDAIVQVIQGLGPAISNAISGVNFEAILAVIRTGFLGALVVMFKQFLGSGSLIAQLTGKGGIFGRLGGSLGSLQGIMVSLQNNIKAKTLKDIAISIALLTASVVALSFINPERLKSAITGLAFAMGELLGAMAILDKIGKAGGFIKMPFIAGSMILLAGAIDILSIAVIALSRLSWEELLKGLGGVAALLGTLAVAVKPLSASSAGLIRAGVGLTAIAVGMRILANAVAAFGGMNLSELAKGLAAVAVGLGIIALVSRAFPPGMVVAGIGLIAIATGLRILANVVEKFATMDWRTMGRGLAGVAGGLIIIAGAMQLMPQNMVLQAAGLILVSIALGKIADAVMAMGGMTINEIAKGLGTLAGALVILAAALYVMSGTLAGAAALAIAAAGIALLAPALETLGNQSWTQILKGLITLAAALTILGIAGIALTPTIPALIGLGAALVLIGAGLALAGAGVFLISAGLSALVVAAPTGVGIIVQAFVQLERGIIENVKLLILGLLEIVRALARTAPQFVDALVKIINSLLDVVIKASPKIAKAFEALLTAALKVLHDQQGKIIQAGIDLIIALLKGISDNIGKVVAMAGNVVINFIKAIGNYYTKIVSAGVDVVIKFIEGIAKNAIKIANAAGQLIVDFLNGLTKAINTYAPQIRTASIKLGLAIIDGMTFGLTSKAAGLYHTVTGIASKALSLWHAPWDSHSPSRVTYQLGQDIVQGMINGMVALQPALMTASTKLSKDVIQRFNEVFKIGMGGGGVLQDIAKFAVTGFAQGLRGSTDDIISSFSDLNTKVVDAMTNSRSKLADEHTKLHDMLKEKADKIAALNKETFKNEQDRVDKMAAIVKQYAGPIKEAQKIIDENETILQKSTAAHTLLTTKLRAEGVELLKLATAYQDISTKLDAAKEALLSATQTRDDAIQNFTDQYSTLPDVVTKDAEGNAIDQLATYEDALKHQADAVGAYQATLDQLRQLGLDDETYQKLLTEGTADQQFASQLLAGGKTAVDGLNKLDAQLKTVSKTLAINAAKNLYQAGVDAATGLVKGLTSQKQRLINEVEAMADEIVAAFNRRLKIKSPSQVFEEIGKFAMQGLANGFINSSKVVTNAVNSAADDAVLAMKKSMTAISDIVADHIDANPVITPILDLTTIKTQADELAALTNTIPITAAASFGQAAIISSQQTAAQAAEGAVVPTGTTVTFEQNNYSPEALTEIEIYRQTRNQISQLKSVLAT